mgnify:FL=1
MKLLILCQAYNKSHTNLGFFTEWVEEFSKKFENIIVVSRDIEDSSKIKTIQLDKEGRVLGFRFIYSLWKTLIKERKNYDAIFVHMIPEYAILAYLPALFLQKKIFLWYTHGAVSLPLKISNILVSRIFTASFDSCRIKSKKVLSVGHGIKIPFGESSDNLISKDEIKLVTLGRITKSKSIETIIESILELKQEGKNVSLEIIGSTLSSEDVEYKRNLEVKIKSLSLADRVKFIDGVPHEEAISKLKNYDVFVSASKTGSLDKAVLEALGLGIPVVSTNEAFKYILLPFRLFIEKGDSLAEGIKRAVSISETDRVELSKNIEKNHSLDRLIEIISKEIKSVF